LLAHYFYHTCGTPHFPLALTFSPLTGVLVDGRFEQLCMYDKLRHVHEFREYQVLPGIL
jgi:hypothetical protein